MSHRSQLCVVIFLCAIAWAPSSTAQQPQNIDGSWWRGSAREQHRGFLAGYVDCSASSGKKNFAHIEWANYEHWVTQFYDTHPKELQKPVPEVFLQSLDEHAQPPEHEPAPQTYKGKHGIFDGEYWREAPRQRESFVQGFLACYRGLKNQTATFSKPAQWYASEISKWYGLKEDDAAEINERRADIAIADVLIRFKDIASPQKRSAKE